MEHRSRIPVKVFVRYGFQLLSLLLLGGCAESMWIVPYPPGERPSRLWTDDFRTRGWNGVQVEYFLFGNDEVEAEVRSTDHKHKFTVRGTCWTENDKGEKCDAYPDGHFLAVKFGAKVERYRFERRPGIDRGIITVVPTTS